MRSSVKLPAAALSTLAVLAAGSASIAPGAPGAGATWEPGASVPSPARATAVLRRAEAAFDRAGPRRVGVDLTSVLVRLVRAYPSLSDSGRQRADRLLARPSDHPDPEGNTWRAPEAARSPACSTNFCVHWVQRSRDAPNLADSNGTGDGDGVPDYVELNLLVAEESFTVQNRRLGWRQAKSDLRKGGADGKTDIYLADIGGRGIFGYAAPDRGQRSGPQRFPRSMYGYLVMDDDYSPRQFPGTTAVGSLTVTMAHEYNHILQFTYDVLQDLWMAETTAVWMEDEVYDSVDDYLRYMERWARKLTIPITAASIKAYGSAVWVHWLQRHYGAEVVRKAWQGAKHSRPAGFSVASFGRAIRSEGRSSFNRDFARFCRDVAEWRTARVFPEGRSYPDVPRSGKLRAGKGVVRRLNHTTFKLLRLRARGGKAIRVTARVPRGTAAGLALVGRNGSERRGRVASSLGFSKRGGQLSVNLRRPGRFERITAVLVNADTGQRGFDPRRFDWRYTHNRVPFRVRARLIR